MKIKSVRIQNFKLLRDVRLEFSDRKERPLTVIRAENGSGKTSTLVALRWGLYGNASLEDASVRLSPSGWPDGQDCEIKVQLDFSHTLFNQIAGEFVPTTTDYRMVRTAVERPVGDRPNRTSGSVLLYRLGDGGLVRIENPEITVEEMLPKEMKDIFFTDGDAAMSFVSPQLTRTSKRDQVRDAIRSLLGLGLLESAAAHIAEAQRRCDAEIAKAGSARLTEVAERLGKATETRVEGELRLRDVEKQIEELARRHEEADKRLQIALQAGDQAELAAQKQQAKDQLIAAKDNEKYLKARHQHLLQDERLSLALLGADLRKGFVHLALLHQKGIIPSGSIPVLQERLDMQECICGTELTPGSSARKTVEELIARQRTVDAKRKVLTELHHAAKVDLERESTAASEWLADLQDLEHTRLSNRRAEETASAQLRVCEEKLARIDEVGIEQVRKDRDSLRVSLNAKEDERRDLQAEIDRAKAEERELKPEYDELRHKDQKLAELNSRRAVSEDVANVVNGALQDIQQRYLGEVSKRMNDLFLEMVGADPGTMAGTDPQRAHVFKAARISPNYEITVYTADNKTLNPDHELNGASKRALTFSFIWALTEVSKVIAPRIIDTPLGMMSGAVKKRVIELITASDGRPEDVEKQVVLFLTRDEIRGIEEVIDARAGVVRTYTNTDHYPVDVLHNPGKQAPEILVCVCGHREVCEVCARRNDGVYGLVQRLARETV